MKKKKFTQKYWDLKKKNLAETFILLHTKTLLKMLNIHSSHISAKFLQISEVLTAEILDLTYTHIEKDDLGGFEGISQFCPAASK